MATDDFFRSRLDQMIDLRHPLAVLARRMPWQRIEAALAPALAHKNRAGTLVGDVDLFGPSAQLVGAGRLLEALVERGEGFASLNHQA